MDLGHTVRLNRIELKPYESGIEGILLFGRQNCIHADRSLELHRHVGSMEICYLSRGSQIYTVGGNPYHLVGGDVFVTFPDEMHGTDGNPQEKSILYWMQIRMDLQTSLLGLSVEESAVLRKRLLSLKNRHFHVNPSQCDGIIKKAFACCLSTDCLQLVLARNYIAEFLITLLNAVPSESPRLSAQIQNVVDTIRHGDDSNLSLDKLAAVAGLSVPRLKARFKTETGMPPGEFIMKYKIRMAKEFLRDRDRSITDIAFQLGFSASSHFSKAFRDMTGMTPSQYQSENRVPGGAPGATFGSCGKTGGKNG